MAIKGKIPPELLQKIKDTVNIIEVVGEHVVLRKSGANYSGLCPFHSERTPSFSVSEGKQLYHCYGCKKGGDLVSFVMEIHGISFPEAIEELSERGRVALPKDWSGPLSETDDPELAKKRQAAREKLQTGYKLNRFVAAFYHGMLPKLPQAQNYFRKRGVTGDLARAFYVGAAPNEWDALAKHLAAKKAPLPLAVELGLIRPSTKSGPSSNVGYFDLFRNRVMFPILDMRGKVAGFGGRTLGADKEEGPKYLNSSESFLFQKSKLIFGLYQAQKHIREKDEVILVEGYFDVVALHAAGFENAVATCGTALTPDHLQILRRFCSRITVLFDSDQAGITATVRAMETGLEQGMVLHGAVLPPELDPDEILFDQESGTPKPGGKERMEQILRDAKPLLDARIDEAIEAGSQGSEAQSQALKKIGSWLAKFRDPVGREVRMQAVQEKMRVSRPLLERAMGMSGSTGARAPQATRPQQPSPRMNQPRSSARPLSLAKISKSEKILLGALAKGGKFSALFSEAKKRLPPEWTLADLFTTAVVRSFVSGLLGEAGRLEKFRETPDEILSVSSELDPQVRSTLTEALLAPESVGAGTRSAAPTDGEEGKLSEVRVALDRSLMRTWARFSQRIKEAMADAEAKKDAGLHSQLMKEYLDVQRKMKEFSSFYDEA